MYFMEKSYFYLEKKYIFEEYNILKKLNFI